MLFRHEDDLLAIDAGGSDAGRTAGPCARVGATWPLHTGAAAPAHRRHRGNARAHAMTDTRMADLSGNQLTSWPVQLAALVEGGTELMLEGNPLTDEPGGLQVASAARAAGAVSQQRAVSRTRPAGRGQTRSRAGVRRHVVDLVGLLGALGRADRALEAAPGVGGAEHLEHHQRVTAGRPLGIGTQSRPPW